MRRFHFSPPHQPGHSGSPAGRLLLSLLLLLVRPAAGADLTVPTLTAGPVPQQLVIAGQRIHYQAAFAEYLLPSASGRSSGSISVTSYVRSDPKPGRSRPLLFAFNGGPGASSSPLHFEAWGPRIWQLSANGGRHLVDNPQSLIDSADLVFIDPAGTGFSMAPATANNASWSTAGDAAAVAAAIMRWLSEHHRQHDPVYIAGESYGGLRLLSLLPSLDSLDLKGVIVISPMLDASGSSEAEGNDLPYVFALPAMAVAAARHTRPALTAAEVAHVYEAVSRFAMGDYASALMQGNTLPLSQKHRLAKQLAQLIGLQAGFIFQHDLRIDAETFRLNLLATQGLQIGRLDSRVTSPSPITNGATAASDPALGMHGRMVIRSPQIEAYYRQQLGLTTQRPYLSLSLHVNAHWRYSTGDAASLYVNPTRNLTLSLLKHPGMKALLIGGYDDLSVPLLAPRYALAHAGVPPQRLQMLAVDSGHSVFADTLQRTKLHPLLERYLQPL